MQITDLLIREICSGIPGLRLRTSEPMSAHCSFRIGGRVRAMAMPDGIEEAAGLCRALRRAGVAPLVVGKGTNLLVADGELDLFVIKMDDGMAGIAPWGETGLRAGCGAPLARLAQKAQGMGLSGLEFAHGIPGTLGGAVSMNAGAYGGEMKDVTHATLYLGDDMEIRERSGPDQGFAYRRSAFSGSGEVILESRIALSPGEPAEIQARMRELMEKRRASQPLDVPSAGSTFKRPEGGFAAALIDQAGLKGFAIGGAQVSPKHAGFVVNRGGATFDDVLRLIEYIQEKVFRDAGVMLEPEVKIIRG
ncbi:MAG TPA: UDP-N-acetylenolpyruvoylglucosamine reductase [Clostridiales bacterium]|nr:UDP-N-acetylenolpyruvoylglucosamine reductase [Clostridiales bacterium]